MNLYYTKGNDMILSDFFYPGRNKTTSNPHKIIPISFNMQNILQSRYYKIGERKEGKYLVQTRSEAKFSGIILPKLQGVKGNISKYKTGKASYKANNILWSKKRISN